MAALSARLKSMLALNRAEWLLLAGGLVVAGLAAVLALRFGLPREAVAVAVPAYLLPLVGIVFAMRRARVAAMAALQRPAAEAPGVSPVQEPLQVPAGDVVLGLARHLASAAEGKELDATVLRIGSTEGRNLLAALASGGRMEWPELRRLLDVAPGQSLPEARKRCIAALEPDAAARLARVVALQEHGPDDRPLALQLYRGLLDAHGPQSLGREHAGLLLGLAIEARDWSFARRLLKELPLSGERRAYAEADLANPFVAAGGRDLEAWLAQFNLPFTSRGLAPVTVDAAAGPVPFDGLGTGELPPVADGPKVTVVITSWKPDACLLPAVKSIVRQTWRNLEILLIDDASPLEFLPVLEQAAALDPRIRLIRQERNGGTYLARNRGMAEATGEYFTVHDSDDWAHPQRIERQMRAMLADARLVSTLSHCLRVDDQLAFNQPGYLPRRENASSLLYRLAPVRERVGDYDASRKGADTEFALRLAAAFEPRSQSILADTLAIIRRRPGSLSREEFKGGWRHPSRSAYRRAYEAWHAAIPEGGSWRVDAAGGRTFRAPIRFEVDQHAPQVEARRHVDVAYALDLRARARIEPRLLDELAALREEGARVALLHMESPWNGGVAAVEAFDPDVERLLASGDVQEILYTDAVAVGRLVVRDPAILQLPQPRPSGLQVGELVVTHSPSQAGTYAFQDCSRHAYRMFGAVPAWRDAAGFTPDPGPAAWPFVISPGRWRVPRESAPARPPRVGSASVGWEPRRLAGDSGPWRSFVGSPVELRLRVSGVNDGLPALYEPCEGLAFEIEQAADRPARLYFATLDFYLPGAGKPRQGAELDWAVEALASACVLVLDPRWQPVFGDAALYCETAEAASVVQAAWGDPARMAALRERGAEWLASRMAPARRALAAGIGSGNNQ